MISGRYGRVQAVIVDPPTGESTTYEVAEVKQWILDIETEFDDGLYEQYPPYGSNTTPVDSLWMTYLPTGVKWTATARGYWTMSDGAQSRLVLQKILGIRTSDQMTPLNAYLDYYETSGTSYSYNNPRGLVKLKLYTSLNGPTGTHFYSGWAWIKSLSISTPVNEVTTADMEFQGNGSLCYDVEVPQPPYPNGYTE